MNAIYVAVAELPFTPKGDQTGMPIIGVFHGEKSGHRHVNQLLRELMADHDAYEIVTLDEVEK